MHVGPFTDDVVPDRGDILQLGGDGVHLLASGELDVETVDLLSEEVDARLEAGVPWLTLDLARVTFCDAAGLRGMLEAQGRAASHGILLTVTRPSRAVRLVLSAAGCSGQLTFGSLS